MSRASIAYAAVVSLVMLSPLHAQQGGRGGGAGAQAGGPPPTHRRAHRRHAEDRRLLPALLGRAHRQPVPRDPALRYRLPLRHRPRRRPRLERYRARPRAGGRQAQLVSFQRIGPKVLLVQGNESFRSSSANPAERRSVEDSFAKSVLWGFTVAAESNGHVLVDASDFFLRDGQGAANCAPARARTASTARAAPSTWRAPRPSPRTPRSKSR